MQKGIKHISSFLILIIFILLAIAQAPSAHDEEFICNDLDPPRSKTYNISVSIVDFHTQEPIQNANAHISVKSTNVTKKRSNPCYGEYISEELYYQPVIIDSQGQGDFSFPFTYYFYEDYLELVIVVEIDGINHYRTNILNVKSQENHHAVINILADKSL